MAVRERVSVPPRVAPERVTITVGIHAAEGEDQHRGGSFAEDGAYEPGSGGALTVADVGRFHEFGVSPFQLRSGAWHPGIPQRSFVRGWFDESQDFIRATLRSQMALVVAGKLPVETAMKRIALAFEGSVKQRIAKGILTPDGKGLAPATIAAKGSSKPLIDTGQLRNAVRGKASIASGE